MQLLVSRCEHLTLVDVVDTDGLDDLCLDEVADTHLGHHWNRHSRHDLLDHTGVAHARDTTVRADVGRDALQGHDRHGARFLSDTGLLRVDDIHDDAALQHLRTEHMHDETRTANIMGAAWQARGRAGAPANHFQRRALTCASPCLTAGVAVWTAVAMLRSACLQRVCPSAVLLSVAGKLGVSPVPVGECESHIMAQDWG